jgi:hypothetical protein
MVQVVYTKEQGLKQQGGAASFEIPNNITIGHPINQTVTGNTVATVNFAGILHKQAPGDAANEINLDGKFMSFRTAEGSQFYVYFDPDDDGAADPAPGGTGIEITSPDASLDSAAKIVDELVIALNANAVWNKEFLAIDAGDAIDIVSLRMGASGSIVGLGTLSNMLAGDGTTLVSPTLATVQGEGSHIIDGLGFSQVRDAVAGGAHESFVVINNLQTGKNHGVQKIIVSKLPENVEVYNSDKSALLGTLAVGSESLHLVWNGSSWKNIHN